MGKRPTHQGTVTVKEGEGEKAKWKKIGDVVVWVNDDESVSGVITVDDVKTNFRAWKR